MRRVIILLSVLLGFVSPAIAQVSIGIGMPNMSIGFNVPTYPQFQPVPGYPVYYAPQMDANYFFYDGMFWVYQYQEDNWYASSWYNGPWALVTPMVVPVYILRVPVRYYREPPVFFRGWRQDAPPPWADHYGNDWQRQRSGWDHSNQGSAPPPAPLPTYQQQYSGRHYPAPEQQRTITKQNYSYPPRDPIVRQHFDQYEGPKAPALVQRQDRPPQTPPAEPSRQPPQHETQHQPLPPEPQHQPAPLAPQPPKTEPPTPQQESRRQPAPPEPQQQQAAQHEPQRPEPQPPKTESQLPPQQQAPGPDRAPPADTASKPPRQEPRKEEGVDQQGWRDNG